MAWLGQLPKTVEELQDRWGLALGQPFSADASCSWVAPAVSQDGTRVVLKVGMPHMETQHEIEGLRFWDGNPTAWLLEADSDVRVSPTCLASKAEIRGRQPDRGMGGTDSSAFDGSQRSSSMRWRESAAARHGSSRSADPGT